MDFIEKLIRQALEVLCEAMDFPDSLLKTKDTNREITNVEERLTMGLKMKYLRYKNSSHP